MFNLKIKSKNNVTPFNNFAEFYIGSEVSVAGNCKTDQDVFIDGKFNGSIRTTGLVELSKNCKVEADIDARSAILEGSYKGDISTSDETHITSCANVSGSITSRDIVVDKGAVINANISMEQDS
ncbi:MAG: polymer-forming cytoskeletal protein [Candidatus Saccharibacteria bacterium]